MTKTKWFISASVFMCLIFSGALYWYYGVMNKVFDELHHINYAMGHASEIKHQNSQALLDKMRWSVEIGGNRAKDVAKLAIAIKAFERTEKMKERIRELIKAFDESEVNKSNETKSIFTLIHNTETARAEQLFEEYKSCLDSLNTWCKDEDRLFTVPNKDKFIKRFKNIPLPVDQSLLLELTFQVNLDQHQAMNWFIRQIGMPCFQQYHADTVVIIREIHRPF